MKNVKSFYNLDYLIEIGEQRAELYRTAYQVTFGRLPNIIFVYSAIGIFLIPIIRDLPTNTTLAFRVSTAIMLLMLISSVIYTIRFLIPANVAYPNLSKVYVNDLRVKYEKEFLKPDMNRQQRDEAQENIDQLIKVSYIDELNRAQTNNWAILRRKSSL